MQAAVEAAWLQQALCIEHVQVMPGACNPGTERCCAVVYQTPPSDQNMQGSVAMCVVDMQDVPLFMQQAVWKTGHTKVVVWLQSKKTFYDLAHRVLAPYKHEDYMSLLKFWTKIQDDVQDTTTFSGAWCKMRFGDNEVETKHALPIAGTIVLSRQADFVLEQMRDKLIAEAYPLQGKTRGTWHEEILEEDDGAKAQAETMVAGL